jgi:autotransporter-associated beta strand protein
MKLKQIIVNKLILCLSLFLLAGVFDAKAGNDTWNGQGADNNWGTTLNWTTGSANKPPVSGDALYFDGSARLTANNNLNATNNVQGIFFNPTAGSFTLTGNQVTNNASTTDNSLNPQTVSLNMVFPSTHTLNAIAGGTLAIKGVISGGGGITKAGGGTVIFNGTNPQTYTGATAVNAGTLALDFVTGAPGPNIINKASALTLGGGTLNLLGTGTLLTSSNLFASTTINAGSSTVSVTNAAGVALGAITESAGGTVVFNGPATINSAGTVAATGTITTTTAASAGAIIGAIGLGKNGAYATVGLYDWATTNTGSPYPIVGGSQVAGFYQTTGVTTAGNYDVNSGGVNVIGNTGGASTLRFNANSALIVSNSAFTFQNMQGILVTPTCGANNETINGASGAALSFYRSTSGGSSYGVIWQNNTLGYLNIPIVISAGRQAGQNNGLVQSGPGTVVYSGINNYELGTYLNGGFSVVTADSGFGAPTTNSTVTLNGGTVVGDGTFAMDNGSSRFRPFVLGNNGGGLAATAGNTMTIDGIISGAGVLNIGIPATAANGNTVGLLPGSGAGTANTTAVNATGTVNLSGTNTCTGNAIVNSGTLALAATGSLNSSPQISTAIGATFDVSAVPGYTLGGSQSIAGFGTVNGSVNTSSGSAIYAGTDGTYGTNTFNNNLTNVGGALIYMDLGTVYNGSNDLISVGGTLALNSTTFHLKAPSSSANLDTNFDYVLIAAAGISGTPNTTPVWDIQPANAANFIVTLSTNSVVLRYSVSAPPSGSGIARPNPANRNQNVRFAVTATPGSQPIGSVVLDASLIGGSSVTLVQSNSSSIYTNTVTVSAGNATGTFALPVTISDNTSPTPLSSVVNVSLTVVNTQTWNGGSLTDDNWSSSSNWASAVAPVTGDFATFAGTTRLTPAMDNNYSLTGVAFASSAGSFTLGTPGNSLTLTANGITNNSANLQTVNTPITQTAAQTINAAAGNLAISQPLTNGGYTVSFDGGFTNLVSGAITGAGGLAKNGTGKLTLSGPNTYTGTTTGNAGTLEVTNNGVINGGALSGAGFLVDGGSVTASGTSTFSALNTAFYESSGTVSVNAFNANANDGTLFQIAGGSFSANSLTLPRAVSFPTAPTATAPISGATTSGLYINGAGATVSLGTLSIASGNSSASVRLDAGTVVVTNEVLVSRISGGSTRWGILHVNGGSFTSLDTVNGIVIAQNNGALCDGEVYLSGGTTTAELIAFGASSDTLGGNGFLILNGSASLYLGSGGIVKPNTAGYTSTISLLNGTLGAKADWTSPLNMILGSTTVKAADAANNTHNIYLTGILSGSGGTLTKTGNGVLALSGINTYSGATAISAGTLALTNDATTGSIANSISITVAGGATFDVSGLASVGGFTLGSGKTIAGTGTVAGSFEAADNSTISPAGTGAQGTLYFTNGLYATNAIFKMELTSDPTGLATANDAINVTDDFTVGGSNNVVVVPVGSLGLGTYKLITYTGNFYGDISNLTCVAGTLSAATPGEIDLTVTSVRPISGLVWRGDGSANLWDTGVSSNWLNGVSYDRFYTGDTNLFDDSATNFIVNLSGTLTPASASVITVNATNDYTFTAGGDISGGTGLTKTNTGRLTIQSSHDYTGVTTINGGTLSIASVANGGVASPIGAAPSASANLVINGGTLEYTGNNLSTDRGATLGASGGTVSVTNPAKTLTLNGTLTGGGSLTKTGNGQITLNSANNYLGGTIINAGTIRGNPASAIGTNTLTLNGSATSSATFLFSATSQSLGNVLNVVGTNNFLAAAGDDTLNRATGTGTVYLNGSSGNLLTLQVIDSTSFNGTFFLNTLPTIRFFPTTGTTLNASNATFNLGVGSGQLVNRDGGNYTFGALAGGSSTKLLGSANSGSAATTYTLGGNNTDADFSGIIATGTGGTGAKVNIVKVGTGRQTFSGANTYTGTTTISNGVLALGDSVTDGSINSSPTIDVAAGAVLDVSGRGDQTLTLVSAQTLRGNGTINGNLTANSGSTISPADTDGVIGLLTVTNALTLQTGSTTKMDLDATAHTNDVVVVQGTSGVTYAGTLNLNVASGTLAAGQTYKLFTATSYAGAFDAIVPATPGAGLIWNTNNLAVNGTLAVVAPTTPAFGSITVSGSDIVLNATNGTPFGQVIILTSTNLVLPMIQWTPLVTNNFGADGSYSYTNSGALGSGQPQLFYRLQTQ